MLFVLAEYTETTLAVLPLTNIAFFVVRIFLAEKSSAVTKLMWLLARVRNSLSKLELSTCSSLLSFLRRPDHVIPKQRGRVYSRTLGTVQYLMQNDNDDVSPTSIISSALSKTKHCGEIMKAFFKAYHS